MAGPDSHSVVADAKEEGIRASEKIKRILILGWFAQAVGSDLSEEPHRSDSVQRFIPSWICPLLVESAYWKLQSFHGSLHSKKSVSALLVFLVSAVKEIQNFLSGRAVIAMRELGISDLPSCSKIESKKKSEKEISLTGRYFCRSWPKTAQQSDRLADFLKRWLYSLLNSSDD